MSDMNLDDLVRDTANAQRMANAANIVADNVNNDNTKVIKELNQYNRSYQVRKKIIPPFAIIGIVLIIAGFIITIFTTSMISVFLLIPGAALLGTSLGLWIKQAQAQSVNRRVVEKAGENAILIDRWQQRKIIKKYLFRYHPECSNYRKKKIIANILLICTPLPFIISMLLIVLEQYSPIFLVFISPILFIIGIVLPQKDIEELNHKNQYLKVYEDGFEYGYMERDFDSISGEDKSISDMYCKIAKENIENIIYLKEYKLLCIRGTWNFAKYLTDIGKTRQWDNNYTEEIFLVLTNDELEQQVLEDINNLHNIEFK